MIQTTGAILIPVGLVFLFILLFWYLFSIHLGFSLYLTRDSLHLGGTIAIRYGPLRFVVPIQKPLKGTIEIFLRPLWSFPLKSPEVIEKEENTEEEISARNISELINWIPLIFSYLQRIFRYIVIDRLSCHASMGCGDPFTTGIMYGFFQAVVPLLGQKGHDISISPDFEKPTLRGEVGITILILTPVSLIILACRLFIPAIIRTRVNGKSDEKCLS